MPRRESLGRRWLFVPLLLCSGCAQLLDVDKDYHLGMGGATGGGTTSITDTGGGGTGGGNSTTSAETGGTGGVSCGDGVKSCGQPADCDSTGNDCVLSTCEGGCCGSEKVVGGIGCASGGGKVCDGNGACVECVVSGDCSDGGKPKCCKGVCMPSVAEIAAGEQHSCARKTDGTVWCWGDNEHGQLGDGTVGGPDCGGHCKLSPVQVAIGTTVVELAAGRLHTCARKADGTLWCWGDNGAGQLGSPTFSGPYCSGTCQPFPLKVAGLDDNVVEVASGGGHTCARKADNTVWCWGLNVLGQLGDGISSGPDCNGLCRVSPKQIDALGSNVAEVALGGGHTCARMLDGTLWCWGEKVNGELGDGMSNGPDCNGDCNASPVQVGAPLASVAQITAAESHTCARKTDGTLWCWGYSMAVGNGMTSGPDCGGGCVASPVQVVALGTSVAEVAAGNGHTCARRMDGTLWCWGANYLGQVGDGALGEGVCECKPSPSKVAILETTVAEVAVGTFHACARRTDGTLWCWGDNSHGQFGDGTMSGSDCGGSCSPSPVQSLLGMCQ